MIREIAISLFDSPGGTEEGDVIVCRAPSDGIGKKEAKLWLWFRADISEALADVLATEWKDRDVNSATYKKMFAKHRYKIPLERIADIDPDFDLIKARDQLNGYQPYLPLGEDMLFIDPDPDTLALETLNVVWDKSTGVYI
jgi:hypothetical protein